MQFFSTRDQNRKVTSSEAIAQGLSNEGGLADVATMREMAERAGFQVTVGG